MTAAVTPPIKAIVQLPLDKLEFDPNVRVNVAGIDELAASIAEHGVLQPIKVRNAGDRWMVVWGQRRVLAARQAGLERIPAITTAEDPTDAERSIEQLVENLHRADLNPIDRARAMQAVVDAGMKQVDLARSLGLAPSTIANDLALLRTPAKVQELVEAGSISPAHVRAMQGLAPKTQAALAKEVVERGLSAHRTEEEVQERKRQAEAETENRERQANAQALAEQQLVASIAEFAKKKVPADVLIVVDSGYGSGDSEGRLVALIKAAGYANVRARKSWDEAEARPSGGVCDCTAWKAAEHGNYDYSQRVDGYYAKTYRVSITKACVEPKHRQAKASADEKKRKAQYALEGRVQEHVRRSATGWALPEARAIAIDRILAEAVLFGLLGYRLPEWSVARGGKRNEPWQGIHGLTDDELGKELAKAIADDFRDHAGYHVDWATLATELGILEAEGPAAGASA